MSASAARSGGLVWVTSTNLAASYTSSSVGAMLKSPATTTGWSAVTVVARWRRSRASQSSLYRYCSWSRARPLGTYTELIRIPAQVTDSRRAS